MLKIPPTSNKTKQIKKVTPSASRYRNTCSDKSRRVMVRAKAGSGPENKTLKGTSWANYNHQKVAKISRLRESHSICISGPGMDAWT